MGKRMRGFPAGFEVITPGRRLRACFGSYMQNKDEVYGEKRLSGSDVEYRRKVIADLASAIRQSGMYSQRANKRANIWVKNLSLPIVGVEDTSEGNMCTQRVLGHPEADYDGEVQEWGLDELVEYVNDYDGE